MPRRKLSAGLLLYRRGGERLEVFLVHPGGPYTRNKDAGVWSLPKGEAEDGETLFEVALREFREETGQDPETLREGAWIELGSIRQKAGKVVHAWAFEGDWPEDAQVCSNTYFTEWPPRSGRQEEFPEVDRAQFFDIPTARGKIVAAQAELLTRLEEHLDSGTGG